MNAKDIMTTGILSIKPLTQVYDIANLLNKHRISAVPVLDEKQQLLGIVSEGDLLRRQELGTEQRYSWWLSLLSGKEKQAHDYSKSHAVKAKDIMTKNVVTVEEDTSLLEIADLLERSHIKRVPVLRDNKMVGIVSRANLIQSLAVRAPHATALDSDTDDRTIKETLVRNLRDDLGFTLATVTIIVEDGVVNIWGMVDGNEERNAIRISAENIPGVKKVDSRLTLYSSLIAHGI